MRGVKEWRCCVFYEMIVRSDGSTAPGRSCLGIEPELSFVFFKVMDVSTPTEL